MCCPAATLENRPFPARPQTTSAAQLVRSSRVLLLIQTVPPTQPSTMSSYGPPNLPDSYEFQIPAGQNIKLMCYYDPQHASVYRADATPDAALTGNSVEYMKQRGFCANK